MKTLVAIGAVLAAMAGAHAQTYPVKPVRMVIPWPAGGSNDVIGRIVAQKLSAMWGQQVVPDNRPGAAGVVGSEVVAKAPADGYTIMVHSGTHVSNASLYSKLPYDTLKDFTPVMLLAAQPTLLVVHPSLPVKSVQDLVRLARAKPGQINYCSSGNGSAPHLSAALFTTKAKVSIEHVPYRGGGPALTAIMSGECQLMFGTMPTVMGQVRAGRLRAVAVTSAKRSKLLPELPTVAESGLPGYELSPWIGIFAPAGLPKPIVDKIYNDVTQILKTPAVVETLSFQGVEPMLMKQDEFPAFVKSEHAKYARVVKDSGARID
jgi:tripartite-type tricarboxylate transporter receptor subunit TctC